MKGLMERRAKKILLALTVTFIIISPLGVYKFGGSYWVLYPAVAFFSLLASGGRPKLDLINNLGFFSAVTFTFFLFRFLSPIAAFLGLREGGLVWYFFVIAFLQGFFMQMAWGVFRNLHSPKVGFKGGTRRSIMLTYGLIMFAPQAFLWFLTDPTGSYPDRVWSDFIIEHFDYFSLIFYGVFVGIFIITLRRHTRESIFYSHSIDESVVSLNNYIRKYFAYPIILALILISESFYQGKNYPVLLAALFPLCLYYIYFNFIADISYRYQGEKPELNELLGEPGTIAVFVIGIAVFLIGGCLGFLQG
jgi:hypothetical protein